MAQRTAGRRDVFVTFCVLAMLTLAGLRLVIRLDFIDQSTGFYNTDSIISTVFNLLYFSTLLLLAIWAARDCGKPSAAPRVDRTGSFFAALLGVAALFQALWDGLQVHTVPLRNGGDLFLSWATLAFSLAAGAVLLAHAAELWSGRPSSSASTGALALLVLHRCFLLLGAFTRHTVSASVSGDVLEIVLLALGTLFFVGYARVLSGRQSGAGLKLALFSGGACAITCAALYLPDVLGALAGHIPFPAAAAGRTVQAAATALYCLAFFCRTGRGAR